MQEFSTAEIEKIMLIVNHKASVLYDWATNSIPRYGDKEKAKKDAEELFNISDRLSHTIKDGDECIKVI